MSRFISPMVFRPETVREGRGFSVAEIQAAGLNPGEARDPRHPSGPPQEVDS